jgi:hypothetical protein
MARHESKRSMKWIFKLLNKPGAKRPAPSSAPIVQAAKSAEDAGWLRDALAVAVDKGEHMQLAARLGRALAERSQSPQADDPPEVWAAAICNAPDKMLALAWSVKLKDDAWLGEVAREARLADVRHACAQRIETTVVLEQVAQASRDKDKRVYRHCADLLRQRRQTEADDRRALEIAGELRGLLEAAPLPLTPLLNLKKEFAALAHAGEARVECDALIHQAFAQLHQEAEARRELQTRHGEAVALASECASAAWPWSERIGGWRARLDKLRLAWAGVPSWLAGQAEARALGESLGEIASHLATLAGDDERVLAGEQLLAALDAGMPPNADMAAAWDALPKPQHPHARRALESNWQVLNASAPPIAAIEPVPTPQPQPRIDHDALRRLVDQLQQAIEQGHLADANVTVKQIKATLGGNKLRGALESRLHSLQTQLEAMRDWARWSTGQARDKLIAAARELLDGEPDVAELALAIRALREEWKRLNAHGAATKAQWERFDAMLEKAYQPVAVHRDDELARQAEARVAKEALCDGWEAEVSGIVWEHADFKRVEARRTEIVKQWHAAPQAGFRDERALRKRFDTLVGGIGARLEAARTAEYERREQLIAAAEALNEEPDLRRAMTEAKALQGRWNRQTTAVRLKRRDEERLWQRFHAACNTVFDRRDAQRAEQAVQREQQTRSRQMLLDAFAATLASADDNEIKRALAQFRTEWGAIRQAAGEPADSLETRANELQQQAQQHLDEQRKATYQERLGLLAQRAALAEQVEAAALAGGPIEEVLAEAKQAWNTLPPLPGNAERLLAQRFAGAGVVTREDLAVGSKARDALLLDLEIALGLSSPETDAAARRQRQLERLQSRFGTTAAQKSEPEALLARCYATAAPPDATFDRRIEMIVRQLAEQHVPGGGSGDTPAR